MSYNDLSMSKEIDKCIIDMFGRVQVPTEDQVIEIKQISDIPGIAQRIRKLRYGPKLRINGSFITTQFRAGFHGANDPQYVESLFIMMGKSSYPDMYGFFKEEKEEFASIDNLLAIIGKSEFKKTVPFLDTNEMIDRMIEGMSAYKLATTTPVKINRASFSTNNADPFTIIAAQCLSNVGLSVKDAHRGMTPFSEKVKGEVDLFCSEMLKIALPELSNRLLAIWFLAESFRYPPMLFYSIVILHCYVNGYITIEELKNGFHPSHKEGSQQIQFFCYAEESGYSVGQLNAKKTDMQDFHKSNFAILERLHKKITEQLKAKNYAGDELTVRAEKMFNLHIRFYLRLCGVDVEELSKLQWATPERRRSSSLRDSL
jgi:hypothetical protein